VPLELRRELRLCGAAFQTLTRLPVPGTGPLQADWLARSAKYFPLAGIVVGGLAGAVLALSAGIWPMPVPAWLAVATAILATGALHEDGLADAADAEGGATRARRLAIMKDPHLGAYGVLALVLSTGLKASALASLSAAEAAIALVGAAAVSRALATIVMSRASYAGDRDLAKLDHGIEGPRAPEIAIALLLALGPLLLLPMAQALAGLAAAALVAAYVAARACRPIGGYTGDVLGAVIAAAETAFLLGAALRWP
jgi:adenosylcobinamide-GDP ribazoletransferase